MESDPGELCVTNRIDLQQQCTAVQQHCNSATVQQQCTAVQAGEGQHEETDMTGRGQYDRNSGRGSIKMFRHTEHTISQYHNIKVDTVHDTVVFSCAHLAICCHNSFGLSMSPCKNQVVYANRLHNAQYETGNNANVKKGQEFRKE